MVSVLSPMSTDGLISFTVQLDDESAPGLRSGLKCDIYVVYAYRENVLRLPSGTYYKGEGNYDLFVREGDRLVRRRVALGEANYDYVEVISGIEPGEQVVISEYISGSRGTTCWPTRPTVWCIFWLSLSRWPW